MKYKQKSQARIWIGVLLILFGALLFLEKTDIFYFTFPFEIFSWSGFVILLGIIIFLSSQNRVLGVMVITLGIIFMFPILWPLPLIIIGVYLISNKVIDNKKTTEPDINSDDPSKIETISVFGGGHKSYLINNFQGGRAIAVFGGSEIDLRGCKVHESGASLEIVTIFGGVTFQAPPDWDIVVDVVSIFGGFNDARIKSPVVEINSKKTLVIKGVVIFGGGEVK